MFISLNQHCLSHMTGSHVPCRCFVVLANEGSVVMHGIWYTIAARYGHLSWVNFMSYRVKRVGI